MFLLLFVFYSFRCRYQSSYSCDTTGLLRGLFLAIGESMPVSAYSPSTYSKTLSGCNATGNVATWVTSYSYTTSTTGGDGTQGTNTVTQTSYSSTSSRCSYDEMAQTYYNYQCMDGGYSARVMAQPLHHWDAAAAWFTNPSTYSLSDGVWSFGDVSSAGAFEVSAGSVYGLTNSDLVMNCDAASPMVRWTAPFDGVFSASIAIGGSTEASGNNFADSSHVRVLIGGNYLSPIDYMCSYGTVKVCKYQFDGFLAAGTNVDVSMWQAGSSGGGNTNAVFTVQQLHQINVH